MTSSYEWISHKHTERVTTVGEGSAAWKPRRNQPCPALILDVRLQDHEQPHLCGQSPLSEFYPGNPRSLLQGYLQMGMDIKINLRLCKHAEMPAYLHCRPQPSPSRRAKGRRHLPQNATPPLVGRGPTLAAQPPLQVLPQAHSKPDPASNSSQEPLARGPSLGTTTGQLLLTGQLSASGPPH